MTWLCDMAAQDPKLMAITPAMREGSGMVRFSKEYPEQYFDVAIAEQHAVTLAELVWQLRRAIKPGCRYLLKSSYNALTTKLFTMSPMHGLTVLFAIDRAGVRWCRWCKLTKVRSI